VYPTDTHIRLRTHKGQRSNTKTQRRTSRRTHTKWGKGQSKSAGHENTNSGLTCFTLHVSVQTVTPSSNGTNTTKIYNTYKKYNKFIPQSKIYRYVIINNDLTHSYFRINVVLIPD